MQTYEVDGVLCVDVGRGVVRSYLGNSHSPICTLCPAHKGDRCHLLFEHKSRPCTEIAVPMSIVRTPEFIAALLEE